MQAGVSADRPRHRLQGHTALHLLLLQLVQSMEGAVRNGFIGQGPEMFRRL